MAGKPLTQAEVGQLPQGAEIVVTWSGGNGPHHYHVLIDKWGDRYAVGLKWVMECAFLSATPELSIWRLAHGLDGVGPTQPYTQVWRA